MRKVLKYVIYDVLRSKMVIGYTVLLFALCSGCLLYTSDAADERSSVDLGGRRIIKKKKKGGQNRLPNN